MKRYPKIKYPNDDEATGVFASGEVVVQEKLDGANFRFTHERNLDEEYHTPDSKRHIAFGSRNVQYKHVKDESKQFSKPIKYIRQNVDPVDIKILEDQYDSALTFFGEAMIPHTLSYDWENTPAFIGFDVYNETDGKWLRQPEVRHIFSELGLPTTPVIDIIPAEDWDNYDVDTTIDSEFGDVKAEGVTFKNYDTQTFAKYVREDFKEKNKQTFGKSKRQQTSGAEKLSYQYITNARIEKQAHKLVDEGNWDSLKMEMMRELPEAVIRDMTDEEGGNIFMHESFEVDLHDFRSITSSRCAEVLRRMIDEQIQDSVL